MSTAVMSQNAMYEFGDIILKNNGVHSPEATQGARTAAAVRYTLTRMASTPANASTTVNLVNSILGNLQHRRLERAQSAPAPASTVAPATAVNTSRYKTELCRPYEEFGVCKYGDKCQFAHGMAELRNLARHPKYKTELCRTYHTVGFCPYGPRCHFVHQEDVIQQNRAVSAATVIAASNSRTPRPRPAALSPALSLDSSSPPCSLSQSPTSSMGSFFSSEPELHSPGVVEDQRLPVFNRLSAPLLALGDLL